MGFYSDFAEYYEAVFPFREEVYAFLKSSLPMGARRILDIGCGTGHYCGRLAADGFDAVGIDLDPQMIETARTQYPAAAFQCLNMLEIGTLPPGFDLIFCIGNSAPHVPQAEFGRLVEQVERLLRPGGVWLFQIVNWDFILAQRAYAFKLRQLGDGGATFYREYRDISESSVRFLTRLVADGRPVFEGEVRLYPMRTETYLLLHEQHGFQFVEHVADFQRRPFDAATDSGSLFVFRKASTVREPRGE